ncbi:MAG: hypothetical protein ABSF66_12680 [Terriglobales bacterium]|jgi:hypothetical protein
MSPETIAFPAPEVLAAPHSVADVPEIETTPEKSASSTTTKLANKCSPVSKQIALVPQIQKIEQFVAPDWKDVAELKSVWDTNQRDLDNAATTSMDLLAEVYIYLGKAHAILSQRGEQSSYPDLAFADSPGRSHKFESERIPERGR